MNHAASEDNGAATLPKRPKDDDGIVNHQRHRGSQKKRSKQGRVSAVFGIRFGDVPEGASASGAHWEFLTNIVQGSVNPQTPGSEKMR